jgi:hypothetical protein
MVVWAGHLNRLIVMLFIVEMANLSVWSWGMVLTLICLKNMFCHYFLEVSQSQCNSKSTNIVLLRQFENQLKDSQKEILVQIITLGKRPPYGL